MAFRIVGKKLYTLSSVIQSMIRIYPIDLAEAVDFSVFERRHIPPICRKPHNLVGPEASHATPCRRSRQASMPLFRRYPPWS